MFKLRDKSIRTVSFPCSKNNNMVIPETANEAPKSRREAKSG